MVEACIVGVDAEATEGGSLRMPAWWNDLSRFVKADNILDRFAKLLHTLQNESASGASRLRKTVAAAVWFADAVAWTFMFLHALIMWGWVIPAGMARNHSKRGSNCWSANCAKHDLAWISKLKAMRDKGVISADLMNRLYKSLRPPSLQPPMTLVTNGETMSQEESHAAWCLQVVEQGHWPGAFDSSHDKQVTELLARFKGQARAHGGEGSYDFPITPEESKRTYKAWDATTATTPDLIPRCVFRTSSPRWHQVV